MSQTITNSTTPSELHLHDKKNARGRFSWVRRLVQGPNKTMPTGIRTPPYESSVGDPKSRDRAHTSMIVTSSDKGTTKKMLKSVEFLSDDESISNHSENDNFSTTPLKSITSSTSTTNPPSILSTERAHPDTSSLVASTAETSLSPSTHVSLSPSIRAQSRFERDQNRDRDRDRERERDSESIITLASSTRRVRRRSIDTNCSMTGIPPASIMERLSVHPAAANRDAQDAEGV